MPFPVIKDLDVLKKTLPKFLLVTEFFSVDPLGFQCLEKRFRYGIIIAVSFPAHTLDKMVICQLFPERFAGILNATV